MQPECSRASGTLREVETAQLHGRTVLVTGAASGIGRATALLCASRGADLVICDLDERGLEATAAAARELGRDVRAERVDVSDEDQMRAFADAARPPDLLVNNAGVGLGGRFLDTPLDDWRWIVGINLMGVVHGCHFFVPGMVRRGAGGHVVNVASMAGYFASAQLPAYTATKFAVLGLSEALREELLPHGIGVTAICPGIVATGITRTARMHGEDATPERRERAIRAYERRNYGPDRVAAGILRAVERNRAVAPITPEAWVAYGLKRASPRLTAWLGRRLAALTERA
jgi:NAD(P)-dependent dehydrogenase (short-subunit alcohol dehydrogenase family)